MLKEAFFLNWNLGKPEYNLPVKAHCPIHLIIYNNYYISCVDISKEACPKNWH